jgi:alpha-glucosidase
MNADYRSRRGVDGFRVDVLWHLIKDDRFRDNPPNPNFAQGMSPHEALLPLYTTDRPEMEEVLAEMRSVVDEFGDRLLIGEVYLPIERLVKYYSRDLRGAHLPFNFSLLSTSWHARTIAKLIAEYEAALPPGGWPNWVLGNHDRPRIAGRVGRDQARIAAMLLLTLRGTPTIYFGDEIGMEQVAIPLERVRDPFQRNVPGLLVGRDGCRTPCNGMAALMPDSLRSSRGCRRRKISGTPMLRINAPTPPRSTTSIASLSRCAGPGRRSRAGAIAPSAASY